MGEINLPADNLSRREGRLPVLRLFGFYAVPDHISVQLHIDHRTAINGPGVRRLSSLLREKQGPVKDDLPVAGFLFFNQLHGENCRGKVRGICVAVKQFYGFRDCKHKVKAALYLFIYDPLAGLVKKSLKT